MPKQQSTPQSTICVHVGSTHLRASQFDVLHSTPKILVFSNGFRHYKIPIEDTLVQSQQERQKLTRKYLRHLVEESTMYFQQQGTGTKGIDRVLELDWFTSTWLAYMDPKHGMEASRTTEKIPDSYTFMAIKWSGNSFQVKCSRVVNGLMLAPAAAAQGDDSAPTTPDAPSKPSVDISTLKTETNDSIAHEIHQFDHGEFSSNDIKGISGLQIDQLLVDYLKKEFKKKYRIDLSGNERALKKLKKAAEVAKKTLSNTVSTNIQIESLAEDIDFSVKLSLPKFEMLISSCMRKALEQVTTVYQQMLAANNGKDTPRRVDYVALVGGSSNIPLFKKKLHQFFQYHQKENLPKILDQIPPEEVIVYGASLHARRKTTQSSADRLLCSPTTLGVEHPKTGEFVPVIARGDLFPLEKDVTVEVGEGGSIVLSIIEEGSVLLGELTVEVPEGDSSIQVTFVVDQDHVLHVKACGEELIFS